MSNIIHISCIGHKAQLELFRKCLIYLYSTDQDFALSDVFDFSATGFVPKANCAFLKKGVVNEQPKPLHKLCSLVNLPQQLFFHEDAPGESTICSPLDQNFTKRRTQYRSSDDEYFYTLLICNDSNDTPENCAAFFQTIGLIFGFTIIYTAIDTIRTTITTNDTHTEIEKTKGMRVFRDGEHLFPTKRLFRHDVHDLVGKYIAKLLKARGQDPDEYLDNWGDCEDDFEFDEDYQDYIKEMDATPQQIWVVTPRLCEPTPLDFADIAILTERLIRATVRTGDLQRIQDALSLGSEDIPAEIQQQRLKIALDECALLNNDELSAQLKAL